MLSENSALNVFLKGIATEPKLTFNRKLAAKTSSDNKNENLYLTGLFTLF